MLLLPHQLYVYSLTGCFHVAIRRRSCSSWHRVPATAAVPYQILDPLCLLVEAPQALEVPSHFHELSIPTMWP